MRMLPLALLTLSACAPVLRLPSVECVCAPCPATAKSAVVVAPGRQKVTAAEAKKLGAAVDVVQGQAAELKALADESAAPAPQVVGP